MCFRTVLLLFVFLHVGFAQSETNPLPSKLGMLTLGAPLPQGVFDSSFDLNQGKRLSTYDAREPIARKMWRSLSPNLDNENTVAVVSTFKCLVVSVDFYMYKIRFPEVIAVLTSRYGRPRLKDIPESESSPHLKHWTWKDKNETLLVAAEPESLQWELTYQVFHVTIWSNRLYDSARRSGVFDVEE